MSLRKLFRQSAFAFAVPLYLVYCFNIWRDFTFFAAPHGDLFLASSGPESTATTICRIALTSYPAVAFRRKKRKDFKIIGCCIGCKLTDRASQ